MENINKEQHSVVVDNLKPSANYEFRVVAINRFGPGLPSMPSNNITMPQQRNLYEIFNRIIFYFMFFFCVV